MDNNQITKPICCGVLEKMDVRWMRLEDGSKCMPYLGSNTTTDKNKYRVNNCPSCGKYVRDVILKTELKNTFIRELPKYYSKRLINILLVALGIDSKVKDISNYSLLEYRKFRNYGKQTENELLELCEKAWIKLKT